MDLNLSSLGTLVPSCLRCILWVMQQGIKGLIRMTWVLLVPWFDITHAEKRTKNTQGPIDWQKTYKYLLTPPVMCTQQLPVWHWMNNMPIEKFTLQRSKMFLLFKYYWLWSRIFGRISNIQPLPRLRKRGGGLNYDQWCTYQKHPPEVFCKKRCS